MVQLALALLVVGAVARMLELFASQAPTSQYYLGVLPGPLGELSGTSITIALSLIAAALLVPTWSPDREPWIWTAAAAAGAGLLVIALTYAASQGVYGVQIEDPRPGSSGILLAKAGGGALLFICLLDLCRRVWLPSSASALLSRAGSAGGPRVEGRDPADERETGAPPVR